MKKISSFAFIREVLDLAKEFPDKCYDWAPGEQWWVPSKLNPGGHLFYLALTRLGWILDSNYSEDELLSYDLFFFKHIIPVGDEMPDTHFNWIRSVFDDAFEYPWEYCIEAAEDYMYEYYGQGIEDLIKYPR